MTVSNTGNDFFAAPQATLSQPVPEIKTSIWSAKGRLGVLKYMAFSMLLILALVAMVAAFAVTAGFSISATATLPSFNPMIATAAIVLSLPLFWIGMAMFIRRLHDLNFSGWFLLLTLIPVIGALFSLYVICAPGAKDGNKYGTAATTATWEKVLGSIGLVFFVAVLVASIIATVAPSLLGLPA